MLESYRESSSVCLWGCGMAEMRLTKNVRAALRVPAVTGLSQTPSLAPRTFQLAR